MALNSPESKGTAQGQDFNCQEEDCNCQGETLSQLKPGCYNTNSMVGGINLGI